MQGPFEYRSSWSFLGLPLVHVAVGTGTVEGYRRGVATGWIAVGDVAIGVLFAIGGVSLGGIAVGGLTLGLLPIGGLAIGGLAMGGLGAGAVAIGGLAVGWYAAIGGLAVAHDVAIGGVAHGRTAITSRSARTPPFSGIPHPPFHWWDATLLFLIVVALAIVAWTVQERRRDRA
jgi:hypothetical protein